MTARSGAGPAWSSALCHAPARLQAAGRGAYPMPRVGISSGAILATDNCIVRVNRSLSLSAVAPCVMSLAPSSILRSFAGFVHHHGPAVFFHHETAARAGRHREQEKRLALQQRALALL